MLEDLTELDAAGLLAAASVAVLDRRLAEVRDLDVLAQWAAVHSSDPTQGPNAILARLWGDVLVDVGGEGTPRVQDHCLGEIAIARGTGVGATRNALADRLDLEYRMPTTWEVVRSGRAEVWLARRVAKLSRHLQLSVMDVVDRAVAACIATEASGRVLEIAQAKIIEADPGLHDQQVSAEKRRRYVGIGRTDEYGLRLLIARGTSGDVAAVDAILTRVAELIAGQHPGTATDELRSIAMGWLARPAELLRLLLEGRPAQEELRIEDEPRATAFPADLLDALTQVDLSPLAATAVMYVHLHEAALQGVPAVARVEGLGSASLAALQELLGGATVTVKPVLDLADRVRSTAYEHPESLKERVHLITGGDYWPYASSTSRRVDYDHPVPYDDTGPPQRSRGQTGTHNSGPLGRRHHRWKTHAGYRARQSGAGRYAWLTPNGLGFLVDHRGTHPIPAERARMIIEAPMGLDLYPSDLRVAWEPTRSSAQSASPSAASSTA